jgi:1,4-dihydroxy-2-naphthoate polyprenyltransferase
MNHWIEAARLRTLPLSVSGIILGSFYSFAQLGSDFSMTTAIIFVLAILTTLGFQIVSNFANDYGDGVKGTDNEDRVGPVRAIQSGKILPPAMKKAIIYMSIFSLLTTILLIYFAFKDSNFGYSLFFFLLAIIAIVAAVKYTVGNSAYGYKGFGDVFVFIFFGLVSTLGVHFLYVKQIDTQLILPAISVGLLSVGVLNLNNMRDEASDKKAGKNTLVVKIGGKNAKKYHYFLVVTAMVLMLIFAFNYNKIGFKIEQYAFVVAFFPMISHLRTVFYCSEPVTLDPELKKLAISTFLMSIIVSIVLLF